MWLFLEISNTATYRAVASRDSAYVLEIRNAELIAPAWSLFDFTELEKSLSFSHVEYRDINFVYRFCNGYARAAVEEYQRRFPDPRIPSGSVFTRIYQLLFDKLCLRIVALRSERDVVRKINTRGNIRQMAQRSPRLSTRRMASLIRVLIKQVWRNLHEKN